MYFVRYVLLTLLLLLSTSCNQNPDTVDADDFGFPKKFITALGSGVQGQNEGQYAKWQDTGMELMETDAKLIIDVKKSWTSWFGGNASYVFGSTICYYRSSAGLNLPNPADYPSDVNDFTALGVLNAPCFLNKGVGLYMLVTDPNIPSFNPNSSENEIKSPSSFTTHLAPNMPGAGTTPNGGWYNSIPAGAQYNGHIYMKILDRYYDDNSGGYKVVFKSGVQATAKGPVETVIDLVTSTFGNAAKTMFQNVVMDSGFIAAVRVVLNIYILFTAIAYMFGLMDVSQGELVGRIFKFGLILALISDNSWDFFNDYFFTLFIGTDGKESGVEEIIGIVLKTLTGGSAEDGMRVFDSMWNKFTSPETTAKIWSLLFSQAEGFFYIPLLYIIMFLFLMAMARAVLFYLLSVVAMSMLVILAPIFLTFMLFSMTRHLYSEWLKQMMSFAIQPVVLFAALALMGTMVMTMLYKTLGFPVSWSPFIHIPFVNIDFKFWMPDIGGSDAHNLSTIMIPPSYEVSGQRYPDLPFLDPANSEDASRISRIVNDHEVVNFQDIFLFMIVVYVMHTFNALVPILARGLAGTANGMMNLEKGAAMMMNNAVNAPGNAASFAGRMAAAGYDRAYGKGSAQTAMTSTRRQLMGGVNNFAPVAAYNKAVKGFNNYQDGVATSIDSAKNTMTGGLAGKFEAAHKGGSDALHSAQDRTAASLTNKGIIRNLKAADMKLGNAFFGADGKTVGGVSRDKGAAGPVALNAPSALSEGPAKILTGKEMQSLSTGIEKGESNVKILGAHEKLLSAMRNSEERSHIDAKAALSAKVSKEEGTLAGAKATMERTQAQLKVASNDVKRLTAIDSKLEDAILREPDAGKMKLLLKERADHIGKLGEARGKEASIAKQLQADTAKVESRESKLEMARKEEAKGSKEADAKLAAIAAKYDPEQKAVAERLTKERDGLSSMQKEKEDGAAALAKSKHPEDEKTMKELVAKGDKEMLAAVVKEKTREETAIKEALTATREREGAERNLQAQKEGGDAKSIKEAKERLDAAYADEKAKDKALQAISKEGEPRKGEAGLSKEAVLEKRLAEVQAQKAMAEDHQRAVVERDTLIKQGGVADPAAVRAAEEKCQKVAEAHLNSIDGKEKVAPLTNSQITTQELLAKSDPETIARVVNEKTNELAVLKTELEMARAEEAKKPAATIDAMGNEVKTAPSKIEELEKRIAEVQKQKDAAENHQNAIIERDTLVKQGGVADPAALRTAEEKCQKAAEVHLDSMNVAVVEVAKEVTLSAPEAGGAGGGTVALVDGQSHISPKAETIEVVPGEKPVSKSEQFAEMIEQKQQEEIRQKKQEVLQEMMEKVQTFSGEPEGNSGGGGTGSSLENSEKQPSNSQVDSIDDRGRNIINNGTGSSLGESGGSSHVSTDVVVEPERTLPPASVDKPVDEREKFAEMIEQRQQEEIRQKKQEVLQEMMEKVQTFSNEPEGNSGGGGTGSSLESSEKPHTIPEVDSIDDRGRNIINNGTGSIIESSVGESGGLSQVSATVIEQVVELEHTPPPPPKVEDIPSASGEKTVNKTDQFAEMIEQRQQEEARLQKQADLQETMEKVQTFSNEPEGNSGGGGAGSSLESSEKQHTIPEVDSIDDRGRNIINNGTGSSLGESGGLSQVSTDVVVEPERTLPPASVDKPVDEREKFAEMLEQRQQEEARLQKQADLQETMEKVQTFSNEPEGNSGGGGAGSSLESSEKQHTIPEVDPVDDRGRAIKSGGTADYTAPKQEREVQSSSDVVEERGASQLGKEDHSGDVLSDSAQSRSQDEVIEDRGREVNERGTGGLQRSGDEDHSSSSRTHEEVSQPYMDPVIEHADVQITHVIEPVVESLQIVNDPSPGGNLLEQVEVNELPKTKAEEFAERIQDQEMVKEAKQRMEDLGTMMETIEVINAEKRGGGGLSEQSGALDSSTLSHDKHEKPILEPNPTTGPGGRKNTVSSAVNIPPTSGKKD